MATIYTRYPSVQHSTCPQRKEFNEEQLAPTIRRLSESSERRRSEQRRRSSVISEKTSVMGSIQSIQAGKLPTNDHLNSIINHLISSEVIEHNKRHMSPDGQLLLNDFQGLLVALQHALHTKNPDELFQSMIYHVRKAELSVNSNGSDAEQMKGEIKTGAKAILKISKLLLFNSKFRSLLNDILSVAQVTLGVAIEVSGKIISDNAAEVSTLANQQEINGSVTSFNTADEQLVPATATVHQNIQLQEQPSPMMQQQQQSQQDQIISTNNAMSSSEIVSRLKEIFSTVQKQPDYQKAISTIFNLFSIWGNRLSATTVITNTSSPDSSSSDNNFMVTAALEAKAILEDWVQGRSLDPIIQKSNDLSMKVKNDPELSSLYQKIIDYIQRVLREPEYLEADQSTEDGSNLIDQVRSSGFEKYRSEINGLIQESTGIVTSITNDPTTKEISQKIKAIHKHLWYDSNNNASFKPQLLNDIRITLIPALVEQVKYVPLPQIVYSDKQYEIAIENMVLSGDTLMPDIFEVKIDDYLRFSPNTNLGYTNSQSMHVTLSGIQTTMEDVVFYYKRKTGFPRLSDAGVVSIKTGGAGVKLTMKVTSNSLDQNHTFHIDQCHCYIDKLNVKVISSRHNTMYKVFNPILTGIIKRQITKNVEAKLTNMFRKGDEKITEHLFQRRESLIEMQEYQNKNTAHLRRDTRRPGLFSHVVNVLNQKVASI